MTTYLSSIQLYKEMPLDYTTIDAQFRKATSNMIAAYDVCKKSYESLSEDERKSLSLIVVTYFGEVSSSLEFLTTLKQSQLAKPILFQNSLHNSTLGFISIQLGLTGPAITLSADELTDQAVSSTTKGLLTLTDHVLVCYVDLVPDFLKKYYNTTFPQLEKNLGFAKSFILSKKHVENSIVVNLDNFRINDVCI